jgi:hypothetical protein
MGARATNATPSGNHSPAPIATSRERRVFPTPPGPVRVIKRVTSPLSNDRTAAPSCSRPISGVGGIGKVAVGSTLSTAVVKAMPVRFGAPATKASRSSPASSRALSEGPDGVGVGTLPFAVL